MVLAPKMGFPHSLELRFCMTSFMLSPNSCRVGLGRGCRLQSRRIEGAAFHQQGPNHSCKLVCQSNGRDFGWFAFQQSYQPWMPGESGLLRPDDHRHAPATRSLLSCGCPFFVMCPSLSRPPLECCLGTNPIQAENARPVLKLPGLATSAATRVAMIGPIPGIVSRRLLTALARWTFMILRSISRMSRLTRTSSFASDLRH